MPIIMLRTVCCAVSLFFFFAPVIRAQSPDKPYLLTKDSEIRVTASGEEPVIAVDAQSLTDDLQGKIPVTIILNNDDVTFENGEQQLLWHNRATSGQNGQPINNDPLIYLQLGEQFAGQPLTISMTREHDLSKLAALAAFFPQLLPIILMNDVTWGPSPTIFYDALMRWNVKVFQGNVIKSIREIILNRTSGQQRSLMTQCSADFIEGFVLFEAANYGEATGPIRSKTEAFRAFMSSAPFKRLMDCMAKTVAATLVGLQNNELTSEWHYLKNMNRESINGLAKIMVGYGFNTFALEAGDFFKLLKQTIGFSNAIDNALLQKDLDRSIIKAAQYSLQSGYEEFFKGQLRYHNVDERYSLPLASGEGVIEIIGQLFAHQGAEGREKFHHLFALTKRVEAIGVSMSRVVALPNYSDWQRLLLGAAVPALAYGTAKLAATYLASTHAALPLINSAYEAIVIGATTYLISPVLQRFGTATAQKVQKPVLDYIDSESDSWSQYLLADTIRYRIDIFIEPKS